MLIIISPSHSLLLHWLPQRPLSSVSFLHSALSACVTTLPPGLHNSSTQTCRRLSGMDLRFNAGRSTTQFSDIDQMPETPQRGSHHRRSHSDTSFRFAASNLDDLLLFDASDLDFSALASQSHTPTPNNGSAPPHGPPMAVDLLGKSNSNNMSSDESSGQPVYRPGQTRPPHGHLRSLSMDSDFFEGLSLNDGFSGEKRTASHRHSNSMDGLPASFEAESSLGAVFDGAKKAMGNDKIAELALMDPKRARRILANRQSAARSKERKIRYTSELERKVQTLQNEATTLSAQVTVLQRDTTGLTAENKELKLRLQAMEQQAKLRDALNEALKEELQHLKITAGHVVAVNGNPFNRGFPPQFPASQPSSYQFHNPQADQSGAGRPLSSSGNHLFNRQPHPSFMDFNQRT